MQKVYEEVPNVLTEKDLDYLKDMFSWNYGAYKKTFNAEKNVQTEAIKVMLQEASACFQKNLKQVLNTIGGEDE